MKSKINHFILSAVVIVLAISGCTKPEDDDNNNNNNGNSTYSQYVEITIDGNTYKYEDINGNKTLDDLGNETFPLVAVGDSFFKISGGSASAGFTLDYRFAVSSTGSYTDPGVTLTGGTWPPHFSGVFTKGATVFDVTNVTRQLNSGICDPVAQSTSSHQLTITTWGELSAANTIINAEGTFSGVLYDNGLPGCQSSVAKPYSGKFKYVHQ